MNINDRIADELGVKLNQVNAAVALLDEGATVPFISRYRKEATGGLDDTQMRTLEERLGYLRELEERRGAIIKSVEEQGKLTDELKKAFLQADSKNRLEDLYLPYKPKRRTKAQIAREAGIEPLLEALLKDPTLSPEELAAKYINEEAGFTDVESVLAGARNIFIESVAEQADLIGQLREYFWEHAVLESKVVKDKTEANSQFADYFDYREPVKKIPSHRVLAILRARSESIVRVKFQVDGQNDVVDATRLGVCDMKIAVHFKIKNESRAADAWLLDSVRLAWKGKVSTQLETDSITRLRESAEQEAIRVFGENLRDLLLAAPAGTRVTMGLDPGLRTGVKVVVVDNTGKLLEHATVYPHAPKKQWKESLAVLAALIKKHNVELISIGNGTASRETDKLAKELTKLIPGNKPQSLVVSEAGASVYSASELAAKEFPKLDVSLRGAVSIARRLQDPLAELVKIEPKAIGVGQYQHDVNQVRLARKLDAILEDCVNAVGVEVNTASVPLLAKVAGLSETLAANIVDYREQNGAFDNRSQLGKVPRLGPKAYEQAAGFLRIHGGSNALDASAVHPEAYDLVKKILQQQNKSVDEVIGDQNFAASVNISDFTDDQFGEYTVRDVLTELVKPGRDPRPEFKTATFKEGVEEITDLQPGMILEGVISNVTNFGAFVDIGVHKDGLIHISALADKFVSDPRTVVKAGDVVKVKVMEVELSRQRIALSMRLNDSPDPAAKQGKDNSQPSKPRRSSKSQNQKPRRPNNKGNKGGQDKQPAKPINSAMADAFKNLKG